MPNIITHILFTDDVYEKLDDPKYDFLESRLQLMEVGGNGPDFLFFHNLNPTSFMKKTPLRKIGNEVHSHSINDFYASAVASIQKEKDPEIRQDMMTYTCGHLCHWALDSIAHPYVFYRTGRCTGKSSWWHHRFESLIDAIMLKVKNDCTISDFKAYETCEVSLEQARAIARIYVPAIRNVYKVDVLPHQILESLNDWCFVEKLFYDKKGTKFKISHSFEKVLRTESMISGFFVPDEPEDPFDTIKWIFWFIQKIHLIRSIFYTKNGCILVMIRSRAQRVSLIYMIAPCFVPLKPFNCSMKHARIQMHYNHS